MYHYKILNITILLLQGGRLQEDGEEGQEEGQADSSRRRAHGGGSTAIDSTRRYRLYTVVDSTGRRRLYKSAIKLQLNDSAKPTDCAG